MIIAFASRFYRTISTAQGLCRVNRPRMQHFNKAAVLDRTQRP